MFNKTNKGYLKCTWWLLVVIPIASAGFACLSNPCLNGICIDDIKSSYSCFCIDGYTGVQCQTNWDECWSNPCQNGGTCIDGVASYNCSCPDGFIGDDCETNYNECDSNPCYNNGTCIDMTNEYICHCIPGFSGEHCELDVAVCNSTEVRCYNGGECIEGPGYKFYCKCSAGWTGQKCEDQIDECESNPCRNGGICIDAHADYMCACAYGYTGKSCEVAIEFCSQDSCSEKALCVLEEGLRVCYCVPDYHGERCELQYDECALGPRCLNGGTCIDGVDNFTCSCPPKLTGALCECLILDDGDYDCEYIRPTSLPGHSTTMTSFTNTIIVDTTTDFSVHNMSTTSSIFTSSTDVTITDMPIFTTLSNVTDISMTTPATEVIYTDNPTTYADTTDLTTAPLTSTIIPTSELTTKHIETETVTMVIETKETLEIDNSKTEATTECSESCSKGNISTVDLPPITTSSTETDRITTLTEMTNQAPTDSTVQSTVDVKSDTTAMQMATDTEYTRNDQDVTTERMFTDSPVETTEMVTEYTHPMTGIETSTGYTTQISTVHSECTEVVCNNHGSCINTLNGVRCHCLFNYEGRFCEDKIIVNSAAFDGSSYIAHHVKNSTSISIAFKAKTLILDGQIMYVDIAKGAYMKLYMNSGLLRFEFSCGYQTMLLSELKTYVNKGYLMKIETRLDLFLTESHCNGTLRLNDTVAMSGGQFANISSPEFNSILYFGNTPNRNSSHEKPFIGCIKDLLVNDEKREIFSGAYDAAQVRECASLSCLSSPCVNGGTCHDDNDSYACACANGWTGATCNDSVCDHNPCQSGGSCVHHPGSGFLCLCPYGKHGIFCEYNVEITRPSLSPIASGKSSYIMYPMSISAMNSDRFEMRLRFQASDMDQIALLAFVGQRGKHDSKSQHLALTLVKGYVMLTWNMGAGPRRIFTSRPLGPRRGGHVVRIWRRGRTAGLIVDGRYNVSGNAPAHTNNMTLVPYIYIGGHPSDMFRDLPHDLPLHSGWSGCVWEVAGPGVGGGVRPVGGRGVGQCGVAQCTAKSCNAPRGVCIHSPATYGCICNEGWFGATCASPHSLCDRSHSRCQGFCVITLSDAQCDCPYGKSGPNCDRELIPIDILFTGSRSYLMLHARSISSVSLALEAEIKPQKERGLLIFVETPHFYTSLSLQGGLLEYRWTDHLSGLTSLVRSGVVVSISQWHSVRAGRYGNRLYVWVDGALSTEPMLAHAYPHTASDASIVIGGTRDLSNLPFDVMSGPPESYSGCFRNFHVNNILLPLDQQNIKEGQNVEACEGASCGARCRRAACSRDTCAGRCRRGRCVCPAGRTGHTCGEHINITIPQFGGDAMLTLSPSDRRQQLIDTSPTQIKLNFTTADPNGLILWINMGIDYFGIGLDNGYLKLSWSMHCNNSSQSTRDYFPVTPKLTSTIVSAGFMADGEWHLIALTLRNNISLSIDKKIYVEEECYQAEDYDDTELFIGGVSDEDFIARQLFPQNFKGCIDKISTKSDVYLTNYSEVHSENIRSCQLFPIVG